MDDSLDTNLIVHFILQVPKAQADKVWNLLNNGDRHHIADLAITEAVHVFEKHYGHSRSDIVYNLQSFFDRFDEVLEYNRRLFAMAFPYYLRHKQLSFNDCYMACHAEIDSAEPLFTFDRQLAKKHASAKLL